MPSRGAIAAGVRAHKTAHPERYCAADPRCLWRLSSGPCPKHAHLLPHLFVRDNQDRCHTCGQAEDATIHRTTAAPIQGARP